MKAIVVQEEDRSMQWVEVNDPVAGPDEVIVRVHATAVNRADLLQRRGLYNPPAGATDIMGLECAGVVESVGEDVDGALVGTRVASLLVGGGYAEKVAVPAAHLLALPDSMSFEDAAAIPEVFYTAFLNLFIEAGLQPGELVMLHAAASGVGTAALQLCREHGCDVIATASGPKLDALPPLGATHCVDRKRESFKDVAANVTGGEGVDVILDPVAASYLEDNLESLRLCGRLVIIGLLSGSSAELNLARILRKRLRVIGSVLRARSVEEKTEITERFLSEVWPWFISGAVRPIIDRVMPIEEVEEAHGLLQANETTGKVVLRVA